MVKKECFITGCTDTPIVISHYESKGGKWKDARPFCAKHFKGDHPHTAYVPNSQMHFIKAEPIEKEPQCTKCGEPANVAALGDMYCTPCYNASLKKEDKVDTLGVILEETQKIISNIAEEIREVFTLKLPSSAGTLGTEHLVPKFESKSYDSPTKEQLECEAAKLAALKEDFNKTVSEELEARAELYNRPPTKEQLEHEAAKHAELKKEIDAPLYNRQPHYEGGIDPITYGKDNFTPEEMNGFYKMNVVKYVSRCDRKNGLEDLQKAQDYLNLLIDNYGEQKRPNEPVEDEHAKRPFKDVIHDLLCNGTLTLKRQSINYWGDAIENYLQKHNYSYSMAEGDDFITYILERA
ncbi:nucleotide kinase [Bacillus phage Wes44]|uniref:Uncharacterized protein n=1 Tax=Bacillus phage Wes44 TaxID=2283012 RepID=A0A346FK11_9CAUD|nr:nucleotide kinase [Bacillus phage Wes44]AXN58316.1 hypothetical protein Wes44_7 [Bacillus phage Wes44]